jgi:tRNA-specific 2-thiouridylase
VEGLEERVNGGDFVLTDGTKVGKHKGYPFYTIGQRKGLEIAFGEPMFVTEIKPETNTVVLGKKEDLDKQQMRIRNYNLVKYARLPEGYAALTRIRYKDAGMIASLQETDGQIHALFHEKVSAIAPGQSAVFYEGNDLVGGGFIV